MSKTRGLRVFVAIVCITLITAMIAGCTLKTPEERFEKIRNDITPVESELREVVKAKAKQTLENNDYEVEDILVKANYIDGTNNIYIYALAKYNESEKEVYTFKLKSSEFQGPLCTLLRIGSSDGTMSEKQNEHYTEKSYITLKGNDPLYYVTECSCRLEGDTIVLEE